MFLQVANLTIMSNSAKTRGSAIFADRTSSSPAPDKLLYRPDSKHEDLNCPIIFKQSLEDAFFQVSWESDLQEQFDI